MSFYQDSFHLFFISLLGQHRLQQMNVNRGNVSELSDFLQCPVTKTDWTRHVICYICQYLHPQSSFIKLQKTHHITFSYSQFTIYVDLDLGEELTWLKKSGDSQVCYTYKCKISSKYFHFQICDVNLNVKNLKGIRETIFLG